MGKVWLQPLVLKENENILHFILCSDTLPIEYASGITFEQLRLHKEVNSILFQSMSG